MLQTSTVEEHTLVLLKALQQSHLLDGTRLVGGTALALQLGHRFSIDLDLFGTIEASTEEFMEEFTSLGFSCILKRDTKAIKMFYINNIKVDFVRYPYPWLEAAIETEGVRMAALKDIAAMKLSAITNRGTRKDFVDIYFLLQHFKLNEMLDFYVQKYPQGSPFMVLRSLTYFEDAEEEPLPRIYARLTWEKIKACIQEAVLTYE